eukprot:scaffold13045_cov266-Ochromonas_danica.AAC.4
MPWKKGTRRSCLPTAMRVGVLKTSHASSAADGDKSLICCSSPLEAKVCRNSWARACGEDALSPRASTKTQSGMSVDGNMLGRSMTGLRKAQAAKMSG